MKRCMKQWWMKLKLWWASRFWKRQAAKGEKMTKGQGARSEYYGYYDPLDDPWMDESSSSFGGRRRY
jgi:hypothetical protein